MPRVLIVGDPHATVEELDDAQRLVDLVADVGARENVDSTLFLGDLYHTHAMMHVEVLAFWKRAFHTIRNRTHQPISVILGNHDMPGNDASAAHALLAHSDVTVIDSPATLLPGVVGLPYCASNEEFMRAATSLRGTTLICHQTFDGSMFDNGLYAPDGVDGNLLPQKNVISGHIHTPQNVGKVWYPGAPRWRTLSDANTARALWVVDFDETGDIVRKIDIPTKGTCREIRFTKVTPTKWDGQIAAVFSDGSPSESDVNVQWRADIEGPKEFCEQWSKDLRSRGARVRTFVTDNAAPVRVKESEGVTVAFTKWMATYKAKHGTPTTVLEQMARERLGWATPA
jgi:DNA repair exonuclease SbcCD nuclease subunit